MPEGPSIVILKELAKQFEGKKVLAVNGKTKEDKDIMLNKKVLAIESWGKHFLICFEGFMLRIHFMLFGSYRINQEKDAVPRLSLKFRNGIFNFYACSVKIIEGSFEEVYNTSLKFSTSSRTMLRNTGVSNVAITVPGSPRGAR